MRMRQATVGKALTMVLGLTGMAAVAGTWDFETDFSTNSNPNGAWSYRYKPGSDVRDGNYTLFAGKFRATSGVWVGVPGWQAADGASITLPIIAKNFNSTTVTSGSAVVAPGSSFLHPGEPGLAVVQWTAPITDQYTVRYRFKDLDNGGGNGINWFVDKGGSTVASGSIANGGDTGEAFAGPIQMNMGESLNFVVDRNGSYSWDATRVQATITGGLVPPAGPTNAASAMYTLNDIYAVLDTRTTNVTRRTVVFGEPAAEPTHGTMRSLNDIMALLTNRAPVPKTGQTHSRAPLDDAALKIGVAWPTPRFTIGTGTDGTNCVTDNLTGLMWARNTGAYQTSKTSWLGALDVVSSYNAAAYGGYNDWRLPNVQELLSVVYCDFVYPAIPNTAGTGKCNYGSWDPFINHGGQRWSSTAADAISYWRVDTDNGQLGDPGWYADNNGGYVWPVRGGK